MDRKRELPRNPERKRQAPAFLQKMGKFVRDMFVLSERDRIALIHNGAYLGRPSWDSPGTEAIQFSMLPPGLSVEELPKAELRAALDFGIVREEVVPQAKLAEADTVSKKEMIDALDSLFERITDPKYL